MTVSSRLSKGRLDAGHRVSRSDKSRDVETDIGQQLTSFAMLDEAIGDAQAFDVIGSQAEIGRAHV